MSSENKSRSTTMIVAFAVVIAVVAYVGVKYPIPGDDAAGTVAPAEREIGDQISGDQVELDDETVAQVMQTDVYQMIISDAAFAEAMRSEPFRNLLRNRRYLELMDDAVLVSALSHSEAVQSIATSDAFMQLLKNAKFHDALLSNAARRSLDGDKALNLVLRNDVAFSNALAANPKLADAFTSNSVLKVLSSKEFLVALRSTNFSIALQNNTILSALEIQSLRAAMLDMTLHTALSTRAYRDAMLDDSFRYALRSSDAFHNSLQTDALASIARNRALD
jgi:hypothetical protein